MAVRAKFFVFSVTRFSGGGGQVVLNPVTSGSEENKTFWKYTPSGKIEMSIENRAALDQFVDGQEVYVDFTPIDPPAK